MPTDVIFLIDLVQDVTTVAPLIRLIRRQTEFRVGVAVAAKFYLRDSTNVWDGVLKRICGEFDAELFTFETEWDLFKILQGRRGFLISSSESTVPAHTVAHRAFKCALSTFITVTLQHGFECLGFLHNSAHDRTYGTRIGFAADVVCSWFSRSVLRSLLPDQEHKLYVAGPPSVVDIEQGFAPAVTVKFGPEAELRGLICENLHSVRLDNEDSRDEFMGEFADFLNQTKGSTHITLRPHPAGRFTDVRGLPIPPSVTKSEGPLSETLARGIGFGISAPSTVLFDMIKAEIPVAVWRDSDRFVDVSNYRGLPMVTSARDWARFAMESVLSREKLLGNQNKFLEKFEIPDNVSQRYVQLVASLG